MQQLRCSKCKLTKPVADFNSDATKATGRHNQCRTCQRKTINASYQRAKARRARGEA
jgi:NAD-dependent SIR2 family protein deacetylase